MGYRNLGPDVSQSPTVIAPGGGQFSAEDHSFESLVFQQGKTPLDWEMNLVQEALGSCGYRRTNQRLLPSCWLTGSFLESSGLADYTFLTPDPPGATTANKFKINASDVIVNGWHINFEFSSTQTAGENIIELPAPPGSGVRTDLVILEVWRALVSPAPDTTNKSPTGQILRFGNAKAPDTVGNQNLLDDILDPVYLTETSKRVQIQYRYRVISGISSITATPDGLDDPIVDAHTVPYQSASDVNGAATGIVYSQSSNDPGLWIAGAGDLTDAGNLGTVDGYMYAIPICTVFRRNSGSFDRTTNMNGGSLMSTGVPTRPDGLYVDQIVEGDVKDLRKSVVYDLTEVLDKSFNQVLDNSMSTEHEYSADGPSGTAFLAKSTISNSTHPGNADAVRTHFSDRCVTESITVKVTLAATDNFTILLSSITPSWSGSSFDVNSLAPTGTNIFGIGRVRFLSGSQEYDLISQSNPNKLLNVTLTANPGPYVDRADFVLDSSTTGDVFVELFIEYPSGHGIERNILEPDQLWVPDSSVLDTWVDTSTFTATSDAGRFSLDTSLWWTDNTHRELTARLQGTSQVFNTRWDGVDTISHPASIYIPETVTGTVNLVYTSTGGPESYGTTNYETYAGFTRVELDPTKIPAAQYQAVAVTYTPLRAFIPPASSNNYNLFYQTRAIQSVAVPSGSQTLNLVPRIYGKHIHLITTGSGSPDDSTPFGSPSAQIPIGSQPSSSYPESRLNTPNIITTIGFGTNTGYIQLPVLIPYVPEPSQVTLFKDTLDVTIDGDTRNFWPKSNSSSNVYSPALWSQDLSNYQKHKTAYPVMMELKEDFPSIGRKGTIILVVFSRWIDFDDENSIELTSIVSDSCAAVYRIRGNFINIRRT